MALRKGAGKRVVMALALAGGIVSEVPEIQAAVWDDSNQNSTWHNAPNWQSNVLPGATEAVTFPTPIPFSQSIISLTGNGTSTFEVAGSLTFNANYTLQSGALSLGVSGGSITTAPSVNAEIDSLLVGSQGFTKLGSGTLVLNGSNTFTGSDVLSAGTTTVSADNNLGNSNNALTIQNGAVLNCTAGFGTFRTVTIGTGGGQINVNSGSGAVAFINGFTADANQFTSGGTGTIVLQAASSRTGPTTVASGTLALSVTTALGTGTITVNPGATLSLANGVFTSPINLGAAGSAASIKGVDSGASTYASSAITVAANSTVDLVSGGFSTDTLTLGGARPMFTPAGLGATLSSAALGKWCWRCPTTMPATGR